MKIIILGAGQVGSTLAENLANEANDVTVVDTDSALLAELQDRLDIGTVQGVASHPGVLRSAGAEDADLLIAVTESDEINMIACQIANVLFRTPTKIARVRAAEYLREDKLFGEEAVAVDMHISPEQLVTDYIQRLIEYPGALQVVDFADGRVRLVGVKAFYGGLLVGRELRELPNHLPAGMDARVATIYRRGRPLRPEGDTVIEAEDEVFFIAARKHIPMIMTELRRQDQPVKRVMIAGGGNIGSRLALALEGDMQVKLIEKTKARAQQLSEELNRAIVLHGDAANEELLTEENIEDCDVFCAVTNDDEANILSAMLAKRLGARKSLALINRLAYVDLVEGVIDIAISPQQSTISALLAHVRRGDVVKVHSLRRGAAEAIEAVAHGDPQNSKVVGRRLDEIDLPPGTTIGAIVRGDEVIIVHHDTVIEAEDHVILFIVNKKHTKDVERLFSVGMSFL